MSIVIVFIIEPIFKAELETWNWQTEYVHYILYWWV